MGSSKTTVNLDTAARLDIICRKGDTFSLALDFEKEDGAGGTAGAATEWDMDVRETDTSDTAIIEDTSFTYTVSNGKKTNSKLTIVASAATMAAISSGLYVYDLQRTTTGSVVKTHLYGTFKVNEDVTLV